MIMMGMRFNSPSNQVELLFKDCLSVTHQNILQFLEEAEKELYYFQNHFKEILRYNLREKFNIVDVQSRTDCRPLNVRGFARFGPLPTRHP
jgi:hypothetical protein